MEFAFSLSVIWFWRMSSSSFIYLFFLPKTQVFGLFFLYHDEHCHFLSFLTVTTLVPLFMSASFFLVNLVLLYIELSKRYTFFILFNFPFFIDYGMLWIPHRFTLSIFPWKIAVFWSCINNVHWDKPLPHCSSQAESICVICCFGINMTFLDYWPQIETAPFYPIVLFEAHNLLFTAMAHTLIIIIFFVAKYMSINLFLIW